MSECVFTAVNSGLTGEVVLALDASGDLCPIATGHPRQATDEYSIV